MVSIITPVYNVSAYMARYMDSVMAQTYTDLEVLLIDDHGTDDSIEKAKSIVESYSGPIRFRFLETPTNSGPGIARNLGIKEATGDYVVFVDSDDVIDPEYCELLLDSAVRNDSDLVCCHLSIQSEKGELQYDGRNPYVEDGVFDLKAKKRFLTKYVSFFTSFMYRREIFSKYGIAFPPGRSSEDSVMLCCCLLVCERISQVDKCMYHYIRQTSSLSASKNPTRYRQKLDTMKLLVEAVRNMGMYEEFKDEIDFIYFKKGYMISIFNYLANCDDEDISIIRSVSREMKEFIPDYRSCPYLKSSIVFNFLDLLVRFCPRLAVLVIRVYVANNRENLL